MAWHSTACIYIGGGCIMLYCDMLCHICRHVIDIYTCNTIGCKPD